MLLPKKALTLHAPWAWAILNGIKRVENREWYTEYRGPIFIHCGMSRDSDESANALLAELGYQPPGSDEYERGVIIGMVDVVDVLPLDEYLKKFPEEPHVQQMAIGPWCWVLRNPKACVPVPHVGNFQLWQVRVPFDQFCILPTADVLNHAVSETAKTKSPTVLLREMFERLLAHYGQLRWWPAESPLEVIVGLVLVRNSQWAVASRVVTELNNAGLLSINRLAALQENELLAMIRPVGRQKAKATLIRQFVEMIREKWKGHLMPFLSRDAATVREELLALPGIGPETADMIALYAGNLPVIPIDDYTKRVLVRHQLVDEKCDIATMQQLFVDTFGRDNAIFNELHALLVQVGREFCQKTAPPCISCPLSFFL